MIAMGDKKYLLIIGDGMADLPVPELGGKTPLEAADKPFIDALARRSESGSVKNCPDGLPPGSDTAILSIFGCDPLKYYTGRAPLEAAAQGIKLSEGDLAFRCNMASLGGEDVPFEDKIIISHSSGGIEGEESKELVEWLFSQPEFSAAAKKAGVAVKPGLSYRHICVQTPGDGLGLVLFPPHDHLGERVGDNMPRGSRNAGVLAELMKLSNKLLPGHPINEERIALGKLPCNCIWFWAEGTACELPSFADAYGKRGAVISAVPLCRGIAAMTGLQSIEVEGATGELDTNYEGKADAAVRALCEEGFEFVAIHIEAPDECTHNHDLAGKLQAIANIDSRVVMRVCRELEERGEAYRMLILSDHMTLMATGAHGAQPVPFIIYDSTLPQTGPEEGYCEAGGAKGRYIENGTRLMNILFGG